MTLKQKQDKKNPDKKNNIPNWIIALIVTISVLFYFILGSWQLSFVIDQLKCKNKEPNCMLPSNPYNAPYRPNIGKSADLMEIFEKAKSAGKNWTIIEILKNIFGISPTKKSKGKIPMRGGNSEKNSNPTHVTNFLTTIDIDGFRPFDIFNNPPGWPYSWAEEPSSWETGYFSEWFGKMQINTWSATRGILYGYLSLFNSLTENIITRFLLTWWMPVIVSLALVFQPILSFCSCLWANFSAGIPWGIFFFFIPIITSITTLLQHIQLVAYVIIGGIIGSGPSQVSKNLNLDLSKGYGRIMQAILAFGLIITLVLFIVDKTKKQ